MARLALYALGFIVAVIVANKIVRSFSKSDSNPTDASPKKSSGGSNVIRPFPNSSPAPNEDDPTEKLKKLKQLHDSGVLTDEEFSEAKAKVLEGL